MITYLNLKYLLNLMLLELSQNWLKSFKFEIGKNVKRPQNTKAESEFFLAKS